MDSFPVFAPRLSPAVPRLWVPKRVMITAAAAEQPHTAEIIRRCVAAGVDDIQTLSGNRLTGLTGDTERETYARAKSTLAVVVAPPSALKPQPIPPSADWRIDLARGCPAHCQYCYLAGSLTGPPVTRVYANLDDVLAGIGTHAGRGTVTSTSADRAHEGTTFELSCYTDPLGLEHLTGSLATAIRRVGAGHVRHRRVAALHHQVRRRGRPAGPRPPPADAGALLGQRGRGDGQVRGWHRAAAGSAGGPGGDGPSRVPGRSDHRAGDADPRLGGRVRDSCSTTWRPPWTASPTST